MHDGTYTRSVTVRSVTCPSSEEARTTELLAGMEIEIVGPAPQDRRHSTQPLPYATENVRSRKVDATTSSGASQGPASRECPKMVSSVDKLQRPIDRVAGMRRP
jgi:hypothetical protein